MTFNPMSFTILVPHNPHPLWREVAAYSFYCYLTCHVCVSFSMMRMVCVVVDWLRSRDYYRVDAETVVVVAVVVVVCDVFCDVVVGIVIHPMTNYHHYAVSVDYFFVDDDDFWIHRPDSSCHYRWNRNFHWD